jgi:hypothetical protein
VTVAHTLFYELNTVYVGINGVKREMERGRERGVVSVNRGNESVRCTEEEMEKEM